MRANGVLRDQLGGMSTHTDTKNTRFRLHERAVTLFQELREYAVHPPKRGTDNERVGGSQDPRRLPASETLLQIAVEFNRLADTLAAGRGDELIHEGTNIPEGVDLLALIPRLRDRRIQASVALFYGDGTPARQIVNTSADDLVRLGVSAEWSRHARRIAALSDRRDDSDALVSTWLSHYELRLTDWVRGHDPEDSSSVESESEW